MGLALNLVEIAAPPTGRVIRILAPDFARGDVDAPDAFDVFLAELVEHAAGGEMQIRHLHHSYERLAAERGWPMVTSKRLSIELCARGCVRKQLDLRSAPSARRRLYGGVARPTVIILPEDR